MEPAGIAARAEHEGARGDELPIAELRLEAFLPADEATSAALTELVTW